jgi:putative ATP-binding cassette transporter
MLRQKRLTYFTSGYSQAGWIFPYVVAAPRYFRGELTLGGLMQTTSAFSQVQTSLSFFVDWYTQISEWCSVVERLSGFEEALDKVARRTRAGGGLRLTGDGEALLTLRDVSLELPDGRPLVQSVNLALSPGDTVLLEGGSGSGKSTLVRAIAGIWPFGRGEIRKPEGSRFLFLPQKPYLPIGTLASVVNYPMPHAGVDGAALRDALTAVGLGKLAGQLEVSAHWSLQLSPGEQQRIAFARALVQKPAWLFLDEATSAIDEKSEAYLYGLIRERLPGTTLFSIGHRSTLGAFHERRLVLQRNGTGPGSIIEVVPAGRPLMKGRFLPYGHNGYKRAALAAQHCTAGNGAEPAAAAGAIDRLLVG